VPILPSALQNVYVTMVSRTRYVLKFETMLFNHTHLLSASKVLTFTADNASNNDTLVDELSDLIPSFGGREYRVRCFAHILNLVVKVSRLFWVCCVETDITIITYQAILSQFSRKLKAKPSGDDDELMDLPINLEVENQLDMFETEVNGEGVGDEELDVDSDDEDEIAGDVAASDAAAVTEIIRDADESIRLDPLPSDEANLGRVSIAKVRPRKIFFI